MQSKVPIERLLRGYYFIYMTSTLWSIFQSHGICLPLSTNKPIKWPTLINHDAWTLSSWLLFQIKRESSIWCSAMSMFSTGSIPWYYNIRYHSVLSCQFSLQVPFHDTTISDTTVCIVMSIFSTGLIPRYNTDLCERSIMWGYVCFFNRFHQCHRCFPK